MESQVPAVVALVVAAEPDGFFASTLSTLADQDYAALSILVVSSSAEPDIEAQVARCAPGAYVSRLEENRGFGAAVNHGLAQIQGADFVLVCHDDIALAPNAVSAMVEESFRSNAGVVTPKVVRYDDHRVLLHVGQTVDRFGTLVERIQLGEVDQGQHDSVRDVFVAPGSATLFRADLLATLNGYDERYVALGDDLEISWRAHLVGARVVCAPTAVVAHAERLGSGFAQLPIPPGETKQLSRERLYRRNELRSLWLYWGRTARAWTLLLLAILNLGEIVVAVMGRDVERAVNIREAWRALWRERAANHQARKRIRLLRSVSDRVIHKQMAPGPVRLRRFVVTLARHGFDVARGALAPEEVIEDDASSSFGGAFSDDETFDELDTIAERNAQRRRLGSGQALTVITLILAAVLFIGSRNLLGARLPMIGQLLPLGSWGVIFHLMTGTWQSAGLGTTAPGHPGYAVIFLLGFLTLGHVGFVMRLLLLLSLPIGAIGVARLIAPVATGRARLVAAAAYLATGLGINAISAGSISSTVAFGAMPFLLKRILRLARVAPFDHSFTPKVRIGTRGWRTTQTGQATVLALLLALVGALSPATIPVIEMAALSTAMVGLLVSPSGALMGQIKILAAVLGSLVLLAPLTVPALLSGSGFFNIFGTPQAAWASPGIGGLLRFATGPFSVSWVAWLLPAAALGSLFLVRAERFVLASRLAGIGVGSYALSFLVARHLMGGFAPIVTVALAPAATVVAALCGLLVSAFEFDVQAQRFGWRQLLAVGSICATLVGIVPFVLAAGNGRWQLGSTGYGDSLSFVNTGLRPGDRILWLGQSSALPSASWPVTSDLAWATSTDGLSSASNLFAPATATAASAITDPIKMALSGQTVTLGHMLAAESIAAIVVVGSVAPSVPGIQHSAAVAAPTALLTSLAQQIDLTAVPTSGSTVVYRNQFSYAALGQLQGGTYVPLAHPSDRSGEVTTAGTVYAGYAPSGAFSLRSGNKALHATPAAWAATYGAPSGPVTLALTAAPLNAFFALAMIFAWLVIALLLLGRHRWLDWWWPGAKSAVDDLDAEDES